MDTYEQRLRHFTRLTSPLHLLSSAQEIEEARRTCMQPTRLNQLSAEERQRLQYLVASSVHPDTGELIWWPFRMASFVPTNLVVTAGLLMPATRWQQIVFWQWLNQSVNVGFNWANANKTTPMDWRETAVAYTTAVSASISVALGSSWALDRWVTRGAWRVTLHRMVPFLAVSSAGYLNVFLMRRKEWMDGIQVLDEDGHVVGRSALAGRQAVAQVALSRVLTAMPCLALPPLIMGQVERWVPTVIRQPLLAGGIQLGLIAGTLLTALPCAMAVYPQYGRLPVQQLESRFHGLRRHNGRPVEHVTFNRGL